jgi:hypothetical protein
VADQVKTHEIKDIMKDYGCCPFFWNVVEEKDHIIVVRNWLTGEFRICRK